MAHQLHRMAMKIAVQMKESIFSVKNQMSVIVFLQEFMSASDACGILKGAAMWLFEQFLTGTSQAVVRARVRIKNSAKFYQECALKAYYAIVQFP